MVVEPESYPIHDEETVAEAERWAGQHWPWPVSGDSTLRHRLGQRLTTSLPEHWTIRWVDDGGDIRHWEVGCANCWTPVRLQSRVKCECREFDDVHDAFEYVWTMTDDERPALFRKIGEAHACRPLPLRAWTRHADQNETEEGDG